MRQPATRRRGSTMMVFIVCLTASLGARALGMDGGRMMEERRKAQAAADAAALAGAKAYADTSGTDPQKAAATALAALRLAAANGYANDGPASTVTVNTPPTAGQFKGKSRYVEVI